MCLCVFNFLFCTGVQLINNAVIISGGQQRDSAIRIPVSILPPQTSLPSSLPQEPKQSSLCCPAGPCWSFTANMQCGFTRAGRLSGWGYLLAPGTSGDDRSCRPALPVCRPVSGARPASLTCCHVSGPAHQQCSVEELSRGLPGRQDRYGHLFGSV